MKRAKLKAMGVEMGLVEVDRDIGVWSVWVKGYMPVLCSSAQWARAAWGFPTRKAAEQYARQLRRAMRGE